MDELRFRDFFSRLDYGRIVLQTNVKYLEYA